jgi:hypothetical protein
VILSYVTLVLFALDLGHDTRGMTNYLRVLEFSLSDLSQMRLILALFLQNVAELMLFSSIQPYLRLSQWVPHLIVLLIPSLLHCMFSSHCTHCNRGMTLRYYYHKLKQKFLLILKMRGVSRIGIISSLPIYESRWHFRAVFHPTRKTRI